MKLFPAIDIFDKKSVRLYKGDFEQVTVYGDPIDMALKWEAQGADFLHIVDLNGARNESKINKDIIGKITAAVKIPVQLGGGIRSLDTINEKLDLGVNRVILGTVCCSNPDLIKQAVKRFGAERIVCGIDCKNGKVAVKGWVDTAEITAEQLGETVVESGVRTVVFTDISRDGALSGVNVESCEKFGIATGLNVIASGGVKSLDDLLLLKKKNVYGAILGKAIYEGIFDVRQAKEAVL